MKVHQRFLIVLLFFCASFTPVYAGTYVKAILQSYTDKNDWSYLYISLDQGKIRFDSKSPKAYEGYVVYDRLFSQLDSVDINKKMVIELNQTDVGEIKYYITKFFHDMTADMKGTGKSSKAKKKDLSTQKAFVQFLNMVALPTARNVPCNGFSCDKFEIKDRNKKGKVIKAMEFWAVPPTATAMSVEDYQASRGLFDLGLFLVQDAIAEFGVDINTIKSYPWYREYPVMMIFYKDGKPQYVYRVLDIKAQPISPEAFAIPANYEKSDILTIIKLFFRSLDKDPGAKQPAAK